MLLYLGLEAYENNELSGITTGKQRQQKAALHRAEAERDAAIRERRRRGEKPAPVVTAVLYGYNDSEDS